jgi:hypothetical protein
MYLVPLLAWVLTLVHINAEKFCVTVSNAPMHDLDISNSQMGNANMLKSGFRRPWPRLTGTKHGFLAIRYCYATRAARESLECAHLRPAMVTWAIALGAPQSATSWHSLGLLLRMRKRKVNHFFASTRVVITDAIMAGERGAEKDTEKDLCDDQAFAKKVQTCR